MINLIRCFRLECDVCSAVSVTDPSREILLIVGRAYGWQEFGRRWLCKSCAEVEKVKQEVRTNKEESCSS